ncbi:hypothetical protein CKA32_004110 [Geitlerinema sp. FC II]|nr:hypothetical protein CKA32_004110 [Geitlerinema sp. FC II]
MYHLSVSWAGMEVEIHQNPFEGLKQANYETRKQEYTR